MNTQFNSQNISIQAIEFSQRVLIQTIQFNISMVFVHTQLNVKTVLFQTIQFSLSTVLMSKTVLFQTIQFCISTQFSSIWPIGPYQVQLLQARVDLGAMAIKGYSVFTKAPALLQPHHQNVQRYIQNTRCGVLHLCRGAIGVFYSPSRLAKPQNE